jgi:hypothetical protein
VHRELELRDGAAPERRSELRPLYSSRRTESASRRDVLYPVATWSVGPGRTEGWVAWIARFRRDEGKGTETIVGTAHRGMSENGSPRVAHRGLFPIFGAFSDRFGFDRIAYHLWPLHARGDAGEYSEVQILWPLFAYGRGGGRYKLRLWPLYGIDRREGESVRQFFLWPFVHRRAERLDTESPERATYILPVYGRRDRGSRHMRFHLFPLLARQWDDAHPGAHRTELLWPIFLRERDRRGGERYALRPLFERQSGEGRASWSVGLGLFGRSSLRAEGVEEERLRVLWAGQCLRRSAQGVEIRRADLWPLLRFSERRVEGAPPSGFLRVPYLLPMRGLEPDGWDRHYNKLFELYGARWERGERRSSLLYGVREGRSSLTERWVSWGGLLHLRR